MVVATLQGGSAAVALGPWFTITTTTSTTPVIVVWMVDGDVGGWGNRLGWAYPPTPSDGAPCPIRLQSL